ncbi:MAG: class I SAM-dependent methyltransferase, partial [Clostridia bacterium]|nr:class I SAM-dependent methyltransferase [Clostridia bacterium]
MQYPKAEKYNNPVFNELIMGPNPIKLEEELLQKHQIPAGATVLDLGCGRGVTSVFLVKEYGFRVFAADLWSTPTENQKFFTQVGLSSEQIIALKADARELPFADEFFDAVVCTDSYNYFGRDSEYLGTRLLPLLKKGGYLYIAVPGMKQDCHDHLPPELLLSWTPEQLDYIHDRDYWYNLLAPTPGVEIISISEMESNREVWEDWLACENEYAQNDRKAWTAGAGKYLNFIGMIL